MYHGSLPINSFRKRLDVTQLSTTDVRGGAAKAAHRLHGALGSVGVRSSMLVAQRFSADPDIFEYNPLAPAPAALGRIFFRIGRRLHRPTLRKAGAYFSPEWTLTGWRLASQLPFSDVVNLHWVADFVSFRTLRRLTARLPVVWTLHDMNPFTGGCHYSGTCERYTGRCGACPQLLTSSGEDDMTRRIFERKQHILRAIDPKRLTIVCPSRWLAHESERSALFRDFDVRFIPGAVDVDEYRPVQRVEARLRLNLPLDARIVLFVAESIADQRKGFGYLMQAVTAIRDAVPKLLLVTLGRCDASPPPDPLFRHLGSLPDSERQRAAYSAADVLAVPSLQDNCPNTVMESLACGTPVVGFATGGIAETIADGCTGLLAPTGDAAALAPQSPPDPGRSAAQPGPGVRSPPSRRTGILDQAAGGALRPRSTRSWRRSLTPPNERALAPPWTCLAPLSPPAPWSCWQRSWRRRRRPARPRSGPGSSSPIRALES